MNIKSSKTDQLAVFGGRPVVAKQMNLAWPPTNKATETALVKLYQSRSWSWNGYWERKFSETFSRIHTAKHTIPMANGTVTLEAALSVFGIGPGDEVIVPALTWLATAMAAVFVGAKPVFVDIEPDTLCLDPVQVEAAITPRTKAIIPVHLYGSMVDMDRILAIAKKHRLKVIEDCAHAHGGLWNGRGVGSIGDIGSFSFQQSKTVSSGEGGCVITNDHKLAERLFQFKHIGYNLNEKSGKASAKPPSDLLCRNYRGTEFQAALLQGQLGGLEALTKQRNRRADYFTRVLEQVPGVKIQARGRRATPGRQSYYSLIPILDPALWGGATMGQVATALWKEGVPVWRTYGSVYHHILWSVPPAKYRIHGDYRNKQGRGCQVSEEVGWARTLSFPHQALDLPERDLQKYAEAFAKVQRNAELLATIK